MEKVMNASGEYPRLSLDGRRGDDARGSGVGAAVAMEPMSIAAMMKTNMKCDKQEDMNDIVDDGQFNDAPLLLIFGLTFCSHDEMKK